MVEISSNHIESCFYHPLNPGRNLCPRCKHLVCEFDWDLYRKVHHARRKDYDKVIYLCQKCNLEQHIKDSDPILFMPSIMVMIGLFTVLFFIDFGIRQAQLSPILISSLHLSIIIAWIILGFLIINSIKNAIAINPVHQLLKRNLDAFLKTSEKNKRELKQ